MKYELLSKEDKALIHEKSLELLGEVGVRVESKKILRLMAEKGCDVDFDREIVRFPAKLIEDSIAAAPKQFVLGAIDPQKDMYLGEGNSYICTDGQGCFVGDIATGNRRESKLADLIDVAKIADTLAYISCFWPIITAHDVPDGTRTIHEMIESWRVCSLHYETDCYNEFQAQYFMEVLRFLFDEETLAARPPLSLVCCPVTPLIFDGEMLEGTVLMGEINAPVVILPMPIAGTTAPMSLFSTVIQNNTEVLAGNAILQAAHPGRKVVFGAAPGILDMASSLFCVGSVEGALQNAACTEMSKSYAMPTMACFGADTQIPGEQSGAERGVGGMSVFMSGADLISGVGLTGSAQTLYLEELVLNEDICNMCRRAARGIGGGREHALTELVKAVGPGGNFLAEASTVAYLKNGEHLAIKNFCRDNYEGWKAKGQKNEIQTAQEKVERILAAHDKENFSAQQRAGLKQIMNRADANIPEE